MTVIPGSGLLLASFTTAFNGSVNDVLIFVLWGAYAQKKGALIDHQKHTVLESARRQNQIALGYRLHAEANDAARAYGVHLNPGKSKPVAFAQGDKIVVLSES